MKAIPTRWWKCKCGMQWNWTCDNVSTNRQFLSLSLRKQLCNTRMKKLLNKVSVWRQRMTQTSTYVQHTHCCH